MRTAGTTYNLGRFLCILKLREWHSVVGKHLPFVPLLFEEIHLRSWLKGQAARLESMWYSEKQVWGLPLIEPLVEAVILVTIVQVMEML